MTAIAPRVRLVRGPSKQSHLVLAWSWMHVFVFAPKHGANALGVTVRHRWFGGWLNHRIVVWQRNTRRQHRHKPIREGLRTITRPTVTALELSQWRSTPGSKTRDGVKRYVRVKIGPGGRTEPSSDGGGVS